MRVGASRWQKDSEGAGRGTSGFRFPCLSSPSPPSLLPALVLLVHLWSRKERPPPCLLLRAPDDDNVRRCHAPNHRISDQRVSRLLENREAGRVTGGWATSGRLPHLSCRGGMQPATRTPSTPQLSHASLARLPASCAPFKVRPTSSPSLSGSTSPAAPSTTSLLPLSPLPSPLARPLPFPVPPSLSAFFSLSHPLSHSLSLSFAPSLLVPSQSLAPPLTSNFTSPAPSPSSASPSLPLPSPCPLPSPPLPPLSISPLPHHLDLQPRCSLSPLPSVLYPPYPHIPSPRTSPFPLPPFPHPFPARHQPE